MTRVACLLLVGTLPGVVFAGQGTPALRPRIEAPVESGSSIVASVNGTAITSDRLSAALSVLIPQESFHRSVSAERMAALRREALDRVVDEELAFQDGVRRGIRPSAAERKAAWNRTVARYGGTAGLEAALQQAGMSRTALEQAIARRLVGDKNYEKSVASHCAVTREVARQFFDTNPGRFVEPEQLHVLAITVGVDPSSGPAQWETARTRAEDARRALDDGTPFSQVARSFSTDPSRDAGGDMGLVHRGSLAAPFEALVAELPLNTPSDVVQSMYGYHIVMVTEVRAESPKTFEDVSRTLISDLTETQCAEQRQSWLAGLRSAATIQMMEPAR